MRVILIGYRGFVGSAFHRLLRREPGVELVGVEFDNYAQHAGASADLVLEVAGNSKKFLADESPAKEFDLSVTHRLRTLTDFKAPLHCHISSVDVYSDLASPATTREETPIDIRQSSHYGFHKLLAEDLVRHYAPNWLIIRLAGMVGPNLRKNPVYDIMNGQPLRIHPESRYQFMHTDCVATTVWGLIRDGVRSQVVNVAGRGLIAPREIAALAGKPLDLSLLAAEATPRVVDVSIEKLSQRMEVPETKATVARFVQEASGKHT